jgi:hypothetical protein
MDMAEFWSLRKGISRPFSSGNRFAVLAVVMLVTSATPLRTRS